MAKKKTKIKLSYNDIGGKYYSNIIATDDANFSANFNVDYKTLTVFQNGRTLVSNLSLDSIKDFLKVTPKANQVIRAAINEYNRVMKEGMVTDHAYNSRTMLKGENIFFAIYKKGFLKEIAEAESPLELTRFNAQCEFGHGGYNIIFATVGGSLDKNTDINTIIRPEDWACVREMAQKAISKKAA